MKNKLYISLLAASALAMTSCERDIDNFMVDDTVGLLRPGLVEATVYEGLNDPYMVYAIKSGKGFQSANLSIAVDQTVLDEYNEGHTVTAQYTLLPEDCYTIRVNNISLSTEDYKKPFEIDFNRERLAEVLAENSRVAIPLRMSAAETGVNIDAERLTTIIQPVMEVPYIAFKDYGMYTGIMPIATDPEYSDIYMTIQSTFIAQNDIDITLAVDPSLVPEGFNLLPEDAYSLNLDGWVLKKHLNSTRINFRVFKKAFFPEGETPKYGTYVLPIVISKLSSSQVNPDQAYVLYRISVVEPS